MEDFLVTKSAIIAKLIDAYPQNQKTWVLPTTKADALKALDNIKSTIELMEDFDRFPEGATGVILYALLKTGSVVCPDVGDFSHYKQGCEQILKVASSIVAEETWKGPQQVRPTVRTRSARSSVDAAEPVGPSGGDESEVWRLT
jgi:hypothetical protein